LNHLTLTQYWMGRDIKFADQLTDEIRANAAETIRRANLLLDAFFKVVPDAVPVNVASGWRPPVINSLTKGAAPRSNHLLGAAIDLSDPFGMLDKWLSSDAGQAEMAKIGLWHEDPQSTPRWAHVQIKPFGSWREGKSRTFKV
jgi:hypothetical protein